jgi:hypothetical protein
LPRYYRGFDHVNTTDDEENVVSVTSTEEEKKKVIEVRISDETNEGKLKPYVERESFYEANSYYKTAVATIENFIRIPIDMEIPIGQSFSLTLQNMVAGTNAELVGSIVYEIMD